MTGVGWLRAGIAGLLIWGGALSIHVGTAGAQSPETTSPAQLIPRSKEERNLLYRREHRIFLNVSVTDASGKSVEGLKTDDFTLQDKEQPRQIAGFHTVDGAETGSHTHVILALDEINSQYAMVRVRKDLEKFFAPARGPLPLPVTLVVLSDNGVTEGQPSTDRGALALQLAQMTKRIKGLDCDTPQLGSDLESRISGTPAAGASAGGKDDCNDQKFNYSLNLLDKLAEDPLNAEGRGLLIWIGPGWPVPTRPESGQIMGGGLHGNYNDALVQLMTDLREADVTLDAVSWSDFVRAKGVHQSEETAGSGNISTAALALPVLVRDTGGQAIAKSKNLGDAMDACLEDAARYYMLAFDAAPSSSPNEYRSIGVKVDKANVQVRTTTAYYAQP